MKQITADFSISDLDKPLLLDKFKNTKRITKHRNSQKDRQYTGQKDKQWSPNNGRQTFM